MRYPPPHRTDIKRPLEAQCPRESSSAFGEVKTLRHRVKVRTPAWSLAELVGDHQPGCTGDRTHDSQEIGLCCPLSASHAGANRVRATHPQQVYRAEPAIGATGAQLGRAAV